MRARAGEVAQLILQRIQSTIPAYARPLEGTFGEAIVGGVEQGVLEFVDRLVDPGSTGTGTAELFRLLGRYEVIEGRGIDVLHAAYRIGARVGWQALSEFGQRSGLPVSAMCELAGALFAYIDELSSLSHEGYTAAQARAAGALERRRKRLLDRMLGDPAPAHGELGALADAARWPLPEQVVVVVLDPPGGQHPPPTPELDADVLVDLESDQPCLVVPAGRGRTEELGRALAGWRAVTGPAVDVADARHSLRWARGVAALVRDGVLPGRPLTDGAEHLVALWLLSDAALAARLARQATEPLSAVAVKQRERLAETLSAWLETRGGAPEIAAQLGVHPQTVRYRLHQLEDLYGERLHDPDTRFALTAALRARRLLSRRTE